MEENLVATFALGGEDGNIRKGKKALLQGWEENNNNICKWMKAKLQRWEEKMILFAKGRNPSCNVGGEDDNIHKGKKTLSQRWEEKKIIFAHGRKSSCNVWRRRR